MIDLIVFNVGNNHYALNIENIQRIIQAKELTEIPNANELIDGMMSHENNVVKVLNFRKLIGLVSYDKVLQELFKKFKIEQQIWVEELLNSIKNDLPFTLNTNSVKCELGMWLHGFNSYDDTVTVVLKELLLSHKNLHTLGAEALELSENDEAKERLIQKINDASHKSKKDLNLFISVLDKVSYSLQKLILCEKNGTTFAIKVDAIEDIAHIEESQIMSSNEEYVTGAYLELAGILDIDGVLINIIKNIDIPK